MILNGEREQYFSHGNIKDLFMERAENYILHNKNLFKEMAASGQLDKTAVAELLLTADMITIAELSPFFKEDVIRINAARFGGSTEGVAFRDKSAVSIDDYPSINNYYGMHNS